MIELPKELKDINLQQMIWDKIVAENKEMHDKQMTDVLYDKFDLNN